MRLQGLLLWVALLAGAGSLYYSSEIISWSSPTSDSVRTTQKWEGLAVSTNKQRKRTKKLVRGSGHYAENDCLGPCVVAPLLCLKV